MTMNKLKITSIPLAMLLVLLFNNTTSVAQGFSERKSAMSQQKLSKNASQRDCEHIDIHCAKTATLEVAPNGDLWRLWSQNQHMYFQVSNNDGQHFNPAQQVNIPAEKISARNENRPKIAFDKAQNVYLSWAMPREKKYTADIRFSYSSDYGKTFSKPVTVNNDNLLTGHSFNELMVSDEGEVSIVWLDGRLRGRDKSNNGSAIFLGTGQLANGVIKFSNEALANGTCVCCRLATDYDTQGNLSVLWRHIYGDNIREFALLTLSKQKAPYQVSYDHWKINGCPHQGGGLSIDDKNRYHMVWFNIGDKGKGIFYANSDDAGKTLSTPLSVGDFTVQAAHPHVNVYQNQVDIVWTQYTGTEHELWHQVSYDRGKSFKPAKIIATSTNGSDRPFIVKRNNKRFISWHRNQQGHWVDKL